MSSIGPLTEFEEIEWSEFWGDTDIKKHIYEDFDELLLRMNMLAAEKLAGKTQEMEDQNLPQQQSETSADQEPSPESATESGTQLASEQETSREQRPHRESLTGQEHGKGLHKSSVSGQGSRRASAVEPRLHRGSVAEQGSRRSSASEQTQQRGSVAGQESLRSSVSEQEPQTGQDSNRESVSEQEPQRGSVTEEEGSQRGSVSEPVQRRTSITGQRRKSSADTGSRSGSEAGSRKGSGVEQGQRKGSGGQRKVSGGRKMSLSEYGPHKEFITEEPQSEAEQGPLIDTILEEQDADSTSQKSDTLKESEASEFDKMESQEEKSLPVINEEEQAAMVSQQGEEAPTYSKDDGLPGSIEDQLPSSYLVLSNHLFVFWSARSKIFSESTQ